MRPFRSAGRGGSQVTIIDWEEFASAVTFRGGPVGSVNTEQQSEFYQCNASS